MHPSFTLPWRSTGILSSCHWPIKQAIGGFWLKSACQKRDEVSREEWKKKRSFHWKLCCSQQVHVARWRSVLKTTLLQSTMKGNFSHPRKKHIVLCLLQHPRDVSRFVWWGTQGRCEILCSLTNVIKLLGMGGYLPDVRRAPKWKFRQEWVSAVQARVGLFTAMAERKVLVLKTSNTA